MTVAITPTLKKKIINDILVDMQADSSNYYIAIGRSETWNDSDTPITPTSSLAEERNFRLSMQSIKKTNAASFVVPRNNWASGTIYSPYRDYITGYPTNPYYVMTTDNNVYICLQQGISATGSQVASTVEPTGTGLQAFTTSDGYVWKYLFTLSATNISNYLTANWIPVTLVDSTDSSTANPLVVQKTIQDAAVSGQILGIHIDNTGAGYTSAPTITIDGDGTNASATATVSGGKVVKVTLDDDSASMGSGYTFASITASGGGYTQQASLKAVIGPTAGIGADPRDDLKSTSVMLNVKPDGKEGGSFLTNQDFRQIAILKGPKKINDSDFTSSVGSALGVINLSAIITDFTQDKTIVGGTSGTKAIIDYYNDSDMVIKYHQNVNTGFGKFTDGEALDESDGTGSGTISTADSNGDFNRFSGSLYWIDNRAAVERSNLQIDDIKAVIKI